MITAAQHISEWGNGRFLSQRLCRDVTGPFPSAPAELHVLQGHRGWERAVNQSLLLLEQTFSINLKPLITLSSNKSSGVISFSLVSVNGFQHRPESGAAASTGRIPCWNKPCTGDENYGGKGLEPTWQNKNSLCIV